MAINYICLVEDARESFREMGFNDAVLEIAEESCLHRLMTKLCGVLQPRDTAQSESRGGARRSSAVRDVKSDEREVTMIVVREDVREQLYRIRPRTIVYLFSGGKDSSLALLLTRDFVRDLCREIGCKVYMLHIVIAGNSHPLNTFAVATIMEWHRKNYGFEPVYKTAPFVFQEGVVKWGLQIGPGRWCFVIHKSRVLRDLERRLPQPQLHIDGMSPHDSKARSEKIKAELELVTTRENTRYWAWHPLFSLNLSSEEKLKILEQHEEFRPVTELYREYGDSLNCVLCPYKSIDKLMIHNSVENLSAIYYFVKETLKSKRWHRKYSKLANKTLVEFTE